MIYATILIVLILWIGLVYFGYQKYVTYINIISVYATVWFFPLVLSLFGIYGLIIPSYTTVFITILNVIIFSLSCYLIKLPKTAEVKNEILNFENNKFRYYFLVVANILSFIWIMPFVLKMFPIILQGDWSLARSFYLTANTNHYVYTTLDSLTLQWIVMPLYYVEAIVSAYYAAQHKLKIGLFFLSLVNSAMLMIATGGRNAILKIILFYLFAFILINRNKKTNLLEKIKSIPLIVKIIVPIGIFIIMYITSNRKLSEDTTIGQNLYFYFAGPIVYFNYIIQNPDQFGLFSDYLFGRATFGVITTPVEIVFSRLFDFNYQGADNIITSYVSKYINISSSLKGNAFSTSLYPFMMDFGWLGIIIGPIIFGQICGRIYKKSMTTIKNVQFWQCMMIFAFYLVFFSEWEYELLFPYTFTVIFYLYIFFYKKLSIKGQS